MNNRTTARERKAIPGHFKALLAIVLFFLLLGGAHLVLSRYLMYIISVMGIYIIATVSLNLTNGYAGLFSLGHAGFMAIGAYASTLLTFPVSLRQAYDLPLLPALLGGQGYQWPFLPAILVAGILAAFGAVLIGAPVLRLRGHYLAVATLGFMVIITTMAKTLKWLTRGSAGIQVIPHYTNVWWVYVWALITVYVIWRIINSSYGRAMMAIRDDETAAQSQGINLVKYKLLSFVIGAFFAGVAGGLYAHLARAIRPYEFSFTMTFEIVIMLVIGGAGTMIGPVVGAALLITLGYALKPLEESLRLYGLIELVYASLLIVIMLWRPQGIVGGNLTLQGLGQWFRRLLGSTGERHKGTLPDPP
ncbi:MAG: branched-chain amino acid ABC transporter permease [Deltaproteobacteria bacterium]|nr:branched-chain amino acid ABC transporter permease [Deltaproteobacteria bacterium]MBW2121772.1 branched-chain amino acid ABC transporter permease [Deltaproteobacteria bacterium]